MTRPGLEEARVDQTTKLNVNVSFCAVSTAPSGMGAMGAMGAMDAMAKRCKGSE